VYRASPEECGMLLYSRLRQVRERLELNVAPVPIVFVAHGLGGLVVKSVGSQVPIPVLLFALILDITGLHGRRSQPP
jgi:hypothetical protein